MSGTATGTPAADPWLAFSARIAGIQDEAPGVSTYELELTDPEVARRYTFQPGQFNMLYLPGVGESAISLGGRDETTGRLLHTVRLAGNVTGSLARLGVGGTLGLRGPFGNGWPLMPCGGRHVVLVAGGIGLAPLRPVLDHLLRETDRDRVARLTILIGARGPEHLLYAQHYAEWQAAGAAVEVTVDRANSHWRGDVGVVTPLIDRLPLAEPENTLFFLCGPEVMMWYAARSALARGVPSRNLWLNMERNMNCAIGLCGHCQFGPEFICKDGPVLPYDRLAPLLNVKDL